MAEPHQLGRFMAVKLHIVQSELLTDLLSRVVVRNGETQLLDPGLLHNLVCGLFLSRITVVQESGLVSGDCGVEFASLLLVDELVDAAVHVRELHLRVLRARLTGVLL